MKISNLNFTAIRPRGSLIGFANLTLDGNLYLGDIGVHLKSDGEVSLAFPTKRLGETKIGIYHPINKKTEEAIRKAIEEKVEELNLFNEQL